jgi:hypothetical protein
MRTKLRAGAPSDYNASPPPRLSRSTPLRGLCALFLLAPLTVMAQRFDVVTFDAPPGWTQQALADGLMFETQPAGTLCQIFLRKSRAPTGSLLQELDREWSELGERQPLVAAGPDPEPIDLPGGFAIAQRVGQVQTATGALMVMLNLLQQDDRLVPVVVNLVDAEALDLCGTAIGDFVASLRLDDTPPAPLTDSRTASPADSPLPRPDPELAARFGNSVVGTWRFALTSVNVTLNAPSQVRNVIEVQFARDGAYRITVNMSVPGAGGYNEAETGTYQVEGQRILMRPAQDAGKEPYGLDWFFGDHPEYQGNWGLILRSSSEWLGSFSGLSGRWRTFKPAE